MRSKLLIIAAIVAAATAFFLLGGAGWLTGDGNVERFLTENGIWGPVVFVLIMWCTQPLGIPGLVYMVPAGIVWPLPIALALSWIGNMGASYIAFAFARWVARDWVSSRIPERLHEYDERLEHGGIAPIVMLRVVFGQLPPADWLLGVSRVSDRNFLIGTGIGIIPGVLLLVVAGGGLVGAITGLPVAVQVAIGVGIVGAVAAWRVRRRSTV